MQPLYKVGEDMAFGHVPSGNTVLSVDQFIMEEGNVIEVVVDSGNNYTRMDRGPEKDVSYHPMRHERHGGVVIPYTVVNVPTKRAAPSNAEWVDVSGTDFDYWRLLCDLWEPSYDLKICEQDVVWRPDIDETFDACPEPWCAFPYDNHSPQDAEAWANMLGCTRFRKELMAAVPDALKSVEERFRDWHYLCDGIGKNLRAAGYTHHWHAPAVVHGAAERSV